MKPMIVLLFNLFPVCVSAQCHEVRGLVTDWKTKQEIPFSTLIVQKAVEGKYEPLWIPVDTIHLKVSSEFSVCLPDTGAYKLVGVAPEYEPDYTIVTCDSASGHVHFVRLRPWLNNL